jgi:hypothetical protein
MFGTACVLDTTKRALFAEVTVRFLNKDIDGIYVNISWIVERDIK